MAISSTGIGSGLDVSSIVTQLVALERKPIQNLQSAASTIQTQISAYGKVQSMMSTLRDAAATLANPSSWTQSTATSADATAISATTSGSLAPGDYEVSVSKIARAQTLYSKAVQAMDGLGTGSLTIEIVGSSGQSTTFPDPLTFNDPATTVEQVRDRINAAGLGVTASVVRNATGEARLALTSNNTGTQSQIKVTGTGGMADFTYPPTLPETDPNRMVEGQAAQDAVFTINGVPVESSSNQVSNAIDGLTLKLSKETTSPVRITVASDDAAQKKAVEDFVAAYNGLNTYLAEQTKYDAGTKKAGSLQGDNAAVSLRNQLRSVLLADGGASTVFKRLENVGLNMQTDGSIKLDSTKLTAALKQPAELGKLFANTDTATPANNGFGVRFRTLADTITGTEGLLSTRTTGLQSKLKRNQTDQERLEERVARTQARLEKQYQMLDSKMASLNGLASYVTQQIAQMNKSSDD